jgi:hypothetical protein
MSFIFFAIAASIVVGSISKAVSRLPAMRQQAQPALPDPRVAQLQGEVDELRAQVERLAAAESFYAQLQAPAPAAAGLTPAPGESPPPGLQM